MIADIEGWRRWEAAYAAAEPVDYQRNLRWFEAALAHAHALGVWPPADPLECFEEKLAYIHRLHKSLGVVRP